MAPQRAGAPSKSGEVAWSCPSAIGDVPSARSGHSLTIVNDGRSASHCYLFGGCGVTQDNRGGCFNEMYVLSLEDPSAPVWDRPPVAGDVPHPRWRHTATLLPDNVSILVFGGQAGGRRFNDTHVFNVERREWVPRAVVGTLPTPRSHHTASLVEFDEEEDGLAEKKIFIIGGYGGAGSSRDFLMDVHALDLDTWTWSRIERIKGTPPRPRSDHTVSVAGSQLILMGGRGQPTKSHDGFFDDVHVLDLQAQEWLRPSGYRPGDGRPASFVPLPSTLWNHTAIAIESVPSHKLFVFGGQRAALTYSNLLAVMDTGRMQWSTMAVVGVPPSPREDCSVAYDTKTCNVVYFGGWAQGWLGGLWLLNVAGIVGPPYAVTSVSPVTGPVTGNTPITISGLNFPEGEDVHVKFTDGKREAIVPGKLVSASCVTCNTPSFERLGALDVNVRVSAGTSGFTVNKCQFTFYVNTRAAKCTAFGPATFQGKAVAGTDIVVVMQAKDSAGKNRSSGGDAIRVHLSGPNIGPMAEPTVADSGDGRYTVCFRVPSAGTYELDVLIDENAFDDDDKYIRIRGSPFRVDFASAWEDTRATGAAPPSANARMVGWAGAGGLIRVAQLPAMALEVIEEGDGEEDAAVAHATPTDEADDHHVADADVVAVGTDDVLAAAEAGRLLAAPVPGGAGGGSAASSRARTPRSSLPDVGPAVKSTSDILKENPPPRVWTIDPKDWAWQTEPPEDIATLVGEYANGQRELLGSLRRIGLPEDFSNALLAPHAILDFAAISSDLKVSGEAPSVRRHFAVAVGGLGGAEPKVWVCGGESAEGYAHDDLFELARDADEDAWSWRCVYSAELNQLASIGRAALFSGTKVVSIRANVMTNAYEVVDVLDVAHVLAAGANESFGTALTSELDSQLTDLGTFLTEVKQGLSQDVGENDFVALLNVMTCLHRMRAKAEKIEYSLDQLRDVITYLELGGGNHAAQHAKLDVEWKDVKKLAPAVRKLIKPMQDVEGTRILGEIHELRTAAEDYRKLFLAEPVFGAAVVVTKAYEQIDAMHDSLNDLEHKRQGMADLADIFDFPESMTEVTATIEACRSDLVAIKHLWDLTQVVQATIERWHETRWDEIDIGAIESEAKLFLKSLRAHDLRVREFDAYTGIEATVKRLLVALPSVGDLRSPCMRDRHWAQLAGITGVELKITDDFRLKDLLALNLHEYIDDVGAVVDRALKEDKMEGDLRKLDLVWEGVRYEREEHREGSGVFFLRLTEDDYEMLEENQLLVQGMLTSKYLATFEEQATAWHNKLTAVADVLSMLVEMQRKWAYLETLFIGSDEVKRELPDDAQRFVALDTAFREELRQLGEGPTVIAASTREGLLPALRQGAIDLERCEKSLADFLEAKRRLFPRFYFVSTTMLLDILSNGNQPALVVAHVSAIMQHVRSVELGKEDEAQSLVSSEGETLLFGLAAKPTLKGKVEAYLSDLITATRAELHKQLVRAHDDHGKRRRNEWLFDHIAQLALLTTQLAWTSRTEDALHKVTAGSSGALADYCSQQRSELVELIVLVQRDLDSNDRRKVMSMITLETHSRDVNAKMLADGVRHVTDFAWVSQLKTRRLIHAGDTTEDFWVFVADAEFRYSFEYLGNSPRLVVTPLTDRIYITATQAAHLVLGCAPAGPAGTGKTETTKDLSAQLGKAIYVFNCGPAMDYRTIGDIFKGIATAGAWGCFDEFNRLLAEVLSVCSIQYKSVLDAQRARADSYVMEGMQYSLSPYGCMAFITMNPGYLGRTELPESLKVLFRPVTVMVPDLQMIIENFLMAEGYTDAAALAKKFFTLYRLLQDLLSKQLHYDWGLRAIKSVLVVAGGFKRAEPSQTDMGLLMRALRDFNLPKIVEDDVVIFLGLLKDLFRDVYDSMPRRRDDAFETLVRRIVAETNLQPTDYFVQNVVDLQDLLDTRHCVFCLASSGCNKTQAWQTLAKVWTKGGVRGPTSFRDINPKAVTPNELYGYVNMATREWKDGLLSSTMRDMANAADTNPKWIILDGDLDANWIENMNSVMDDNRLLTLASNERIRLLPNMRMIFEVRDLNYATPATVTRAGILYVSELDQWANFVASWVDQRKRTELNSGRVEPGAAEERAEKLLALFETYCKPTLAEMHRSYKSLIPVLDFALVQSLCYMLEGLITVDNVGATEQTDKFDVYFVFAAVWAFGGTLSTSGGLDYRKLFSKWWKETWRDVKFPHRGEVFDFFVDAEHCEFRAWSEVVVPFSFDSATMTASTVTVPTVETVSVSFWLSQLITNRHPAMLVGTAGVGKTAIINGKLRTLSDDYMASTINVNYFTNAALFQRILEAPLEKKAGRNFGPPGSKSLIYFVDDLNMAALDKYNTASNISLMRQHLAYGHVYDINKLTQKTLLNTQYLAAMNPTAGSFVVNPRLQRLFATFAVGFPSAESLTTVYSSFLLAHVTAVVPHMHEVAKKVVQAALQLHKRVASTFRKTASKFHYEFNIRHIAGVFQGMLMASGEELSEPLSMVQLWLHESERVYGDRLVSLDDLRRYRDLALEQQRRHFKEFSPTLAFAEPLIFCHFAKGTGESKYAKVASFSGLSKLLESSLDEYNEANPVMHLVLFEDAMRHVCRISRIIEAPGGHALLVGVGGSGKQSLTRLAAFVSGFAVVQLVISASYGVNELKHDLQAMYRRCGVKGEGTVFLFTDQQIADERFLVYINDLLSSGEIPGLFPQEDVDEIVGLVRPVLKRAGKPDSKAECWAHFLSQVRSNLHVALSFSPVGEPIKVRTRRFPALVNCVVIDWFQPWPEEALLSVSKRFLNDVHLGSDQMRSAVCSFMPFSFLAVNELSQKYLEQERRFNWTTPKSFLELIHLYTNMLAARRKQTDDQITRYQSGVHKLHATAESVSILEQQLQTKQQEVEEKKAQCDALVPQMAEQKDRAAEESKAAADVALQAGEKEVQVSEMKKRIDADLQAAQPALEKAAAALDSLNKKDLGELKTLAKPPPGIEDVTSAVVQMLADGSKKPDTSWKATTVLMKDLNQFMAELGAFRDRIDAGNVPKQNFKNIRPLLEKEWFNVDTMRSKSAAAAGLCEWVLNITEYWDINENVEPMRQAAQQAEADLANAIAAKEEALRKASEAEDMVNQLTAAYEAALSEKDAVIAEGELCARKLALAHRLMASLGSEGDRWRSAILELHNEHDKLVGEVLLASAFVSYAGCFNKRFRKMLVEGTFVPYIQNPKHEIPMSEVADPLRVLTTEAEMAQWSNENLPTDRVSAENGAIVCNSARWPLMIDPQLQGITWIKKREEDSGLRVLRLDGPAILFTIEEAMRTGKPIVIENLGTTIDAMLAPLIGRQTIRRGRTSYIKLGDKEVDYTSGFRLYLQTKLTNPHYPPEIQAETTLVNFMVTEDGLEDQLLALTVSKERPDLEEQKLVLIQEQNGYKLKIKDLEDSILAQLANAEGDVLENLTLIENLEASKKVATSIAEKVAVSRQTEASINEARESYRKVAARGALVFFLLAELTMLHTFHHYSLNAFLVVFERAITGQKRKFKMSESSLLKQILPNLKEKPRRAGTLWDKVDTRKTIAASMNAEQLAERVLSLTASITYSVFSYARRGLFESHKLVVATQLAFKVMRAEGELIEAEYEALVIARRMPQPPAMPDKVGDYISDSQWAAVCGLRDLEPFRGLADDLEASDAAWQDWIAGATPEEEEPPAEWAKLTPMQRILLLRALRPDRVVAGLRSFIAMRLGEQFVAHEPQTLLDCFADSTASTPLLFVLFPGVDPGADIEALGRELGFSTENSRYVSISMGQGQEAHAEAMLQRYAAEGGWVFLQNVHLMQSWLPKLEKQLEQCAETGHSDFRCYLSAEPPPLPTMQTVPESILQAAIKIANEPPTDIKANMLVALTTVGEKTFESSSKPEQFKPVIFSLSFFHALVLGRRRFGCLGFSRSYPFSAGDFAVCASVVKNYVESKDSVPWSDLRYIVGDIMYGGHVTDPWDRRCTSAYLEALLHSKLLEQKGDFMLAPGLKGFAQGSFSDARAHVNERMPHESPTLFGLHANAEIGLLISRADELFKSILVLSGAGSGSGTSGGVGSGAAAAAKEAKVLQTLTELQIKLPVVRSLAEIKGKVLDRAAPYSVFLLQEVERLNHLLGDIKMNLAELELGLTGALNITDTMDGLITALHTNTVPNNWLRACGQMGPTGSYNRKPLLEWFADMMLRDKQLTEWSRDPNKLPVTARAKGLPLDSMTVSTTVLPFMPEQVIEQPDEGTYTHGLFIEGALWDIENASIIASRPKELHSLMPVIHLKGVTTRDAHSNQLMYDCPVYTTTVRGPTYQFTAVLPTAAPPIAWVLAGVCLLMQADN